MAASAARTRRCSFALRLTATNCSVSMCSLGHFTPRRVVQVSVEQERTSDIRLARLVAEGGRLRALLLELWQRTRMDWGFVTDRLATAFRKETWLGAHERRFVSETLYGMVRHLRRIDLAIARGRRVRKPP